MISAGRLNKRITLLAPQTIQQSNGEFQQNEKAIMRVWAEIMTMTARELVRNGKTEEELTYTFRIRYASGIDATWTINYGSRKFRISKIVNVAEANIALDIVATEIK